MKFPSNLPEGVFTAALTPLNEDLSVNYELLVQHCQNLLDQGSNGLALLGTTGEANSFSLSERKQILEKTLAGGIPANKLMVGTGCCALPDTIELSKHALSMGVNGLLVLPPFYYKQVADSGLMHYFEDFIDGVNDDRMRMYLYHFPKMSGLPFSIPFIQQLRSTYPGMITGIKDSSGDVENMRQMIAEIPGFKVFAGTEKYLLDVLRAGGAGCISATANATISLAAQLYAKWKAGEEVESLNAHMVKVRTAFEGLPFTGALKSYLAQEQQNKSWLHVRPPNEKLDEPSLNKLTAALTQLKFSLNSPHI